MIQLNKLIMAVTSGHGRFFIMGGNMYGKIAAHVDAGAKDLLESLAVNSGYGPIVNALHLHEMAVSRHHWSQPIRSYDVLLFSAFLHIYRDEGIITRGDMREILYTLGVCSADIEKLMNRAVLSRTLMEQAMAYAEFDDPVNRHQRRKAEKKKRKHK